MIFHPRVIEESLEGFFQAFRHSLDVALLWFRSGEKSNDERERERERWRAFLSSVLLAKHSFDLWRKLRSTRSLPSMPILKNPQSQYVCFIVVVLFFSLLLSPVHFGDRSAVVNTEETPPSALSGLCFHFSPPPLIRSVGLLF
jgi:hypothetical protein